MSVATDSQNRWVIWALTAIIGVVITIVGSGFILRENVVRHDERIKHVDERSIDNKIAIAAVIEDYRKSLSQIKDDIDSQKSSQSATFHELKRMREAIERLIK